VPRAWALLAAAFAAIAASSALAAPVPGHPGHDHGSGQGNPPHAGAPGHPPHVEQAPAVPEHVATTPAVAPAAPASDQQKGGPDKPAKAAKAAKPDEKTAAPTVPDTGQAAHDHGHGTKDTGQATKDAAKPPKDTVKPPKDTGKTEAAVRKAATAITQPVAPATAAVATAVPAAVAPAATPAAPASSPATPAPAASTPQRRPTARIVAAAPRQARRAVAAPRAGTLAATAAAPAAAGAPRSAAKPPVATAPARHPHASQPSSPLIRRVERILKVLPGWVGIVLAALLAGGLLLGTAALRQTLRARRLERDRRRLAADVGLLQSALLPTLPEQVGHARVSAAYRPAAGLAAGGDFFDVFALPGGRTALILGDMAGHGREIVPFTALVRYSLRAYLEAGLAPRTALQVASTVLEAQLAGHMVAASVAVFDPEAGLLTYACAGQSQPLLGPSTPSTVTAVSSPPIGAGVLTGRRQTTVGLPPGSAACFCTDGVADVCIADRRLGPEALAAQFAALGPAATADELLASVVRASDSQPDDMAVCLLAPLPGSAQPGPEVVEELEVDAEMLADGRAARFLAACSMGSAAAAAAERSVAEMVARRGSAILVVRRGDAGVEWRVDRPPTAILPAARPGPRAVATAVAS
jgi:hypothetical protein